MNSKDISIILQGPLYEEYPIKKTVENLRVVFPGCQIILSSIESYTDNNKIFDKIVKVDDPGELPPLKFDSRPNNINRQIKSTVLGIKNADRPLILKLRTDQNLNTNKILTLWNEIQKYNKNRNNIYSIGRILTISLFSLKPYLNERFPYHISDILLFGYKQDLERYFSCPIYPKEYANWYEKNPHASYSNLVERKFRSRYAVEQWLCLNFFFPKQDFPIHFHNHHNEQIIKEFEDKISDTFFICHPKDIDLSMPKFQKSYDSPFCNFYCYSTKDFINLLHKKHNITVNFKPQYAFPDAVENREKLFKIYHLSPYLIKRIFNLKKTILKIYSFFSIIRKQKLNKTDN